MKNFKSPLEQFDYSINYVLFKTLSLSNFNIILILNLIAVLFILKSKTRRIFILNNYIYIIHLTFSFVRSVLKSTLSTKKSSFIFLFLPLFLIILTSNVIGMIPYSITLTTQFFFTFFYALSCFLGILIIGVFYHKERFFNTFLPSGIPLIIIPSLIIIEYISYFSRVLSLALRLFANMLSGHILIKILITFTWVLLCSASIPAIVSVIPLFIIFSVTVLELIISFLQSYVFIILVSIYVDETINQH